MFCKHYIMTVITPNWEVPFYLVSLCLEKFDKVALSSDTFWYILLIQIYYTPALLKEKF